MSATALIEQARTSARSRIGELPVALKYHDLIEANRSFDSSCCMICVWFCQTSSCFVNDHLGFKMAFEVSRRLHQRLDCIILGSNSGVTINSVRGTTKPVGEVGVSNTVAIVARYATVGYSEGEWGAVCIVRCSHCGNLTAGKWFTAFRCGDHLSQTVYRLSCCRHICALM